VPSCLRAGVDVVAFSGDKLLGGPQAGLVAGKGPRIGALRRNPLYRALRVDKLTLAALDVVLTDHQSGLAAQRVPVLRMAALSIHEVRVRADAFARALREASPGLDVAVSDGASAIGGGAAPALELPTALVTIGHWNLGPDRLAAALRAGEPPVIVRVAEGRVVVDLRTVLTDEEPLLLKALVRAVALP
jgi:L-seryl-tRNA(Ser) seleniumtransferase